MWRYLAYLYDDGFKIEISDTSPKIVGWGNYVNADNFTIRIKGPFGVFYWEDTKDRLIPFFSVLSDEYNISGKIAFNNQNTKTHFYSVEDILNDTIEEIGTKTIYIQIFLREKS